MKRIIVAISVLFCFNGCRESIHYAPSISAADTVKFHLVVDVASVELFADDGMTVMTDIMFPREVLGKVGVFAEGGSLNLVKGNVTRLSPP